MVTIGFALIALQFPYIYNPADAATWIYIRVFGVLYYPTVFSLLFQRYFYRRILFNSWKGSIYTVLPLFLIITVGLLSQFAGKFIVDNFTVVSIVCGVVGIMSALYLIVETHKLKMKIIKYHYDNFSCERDFPFLFAQKILYSPLIYVIAMWIVFITGSQWFKFGLDIVCSIFMVCFLALILHPQRARKFAYRNDENVEILEDDIPVADDIATDEKQMIISEVLGLNDEPETDIDDDLDSNIHIEVASIIERLYRNPDLMKSQVIDEVGYGRKSIAKNYLSEVGFYNFVNAYRLEHARLYKEEYPKATVDEIASAAGFRDRFAFNYAKRKANQEKSLIIGDFKPNIK